MVSTRTRRSSIRAGVLAIAVCLLAAFSANAQSTGTLTGTVTDPSSAVIPNANVVCRNTQTGVTHSAITNEAGLFRFPDLPIGQYELTVTAPNFERLVRSGLEMLTGRTMDVTLQLRVGETTQSLEVSAAAPITQTTTSEVQTTFTTKNTVELPLNGRNPMQLIVLTPGARLSSVGTQGNQQQNTGVTTNGLRALDNNYELDGTLYMDRFFDAAPILPNPDALQEFTVKASNYGATESGAGATVQLSTRSGTNDIHGSAFEFLRNDFFDARNFFAKTTTPFKRNQFGGTVGGPIIRDKTFYFASYQGTRVSGGANPTLTTVPTAAMRLGDFSNLTKAIVNPATGQPFPGNRIPASQLDPLATKLLAYVPEPNLPNLQLAQTPNPDINDDQFLIRVDHALSDKDRLSFRYSFDEYDYNRLTSNFNTIFARNLFRNQNALGSITHTFSPALIFHGSFGWTRVARTQNPTEPTTAQALGQNAPFAIEGSAPELRVNVNGYFNLFSGGGLHSGTETYNYRGRFTWAKGKHLLQFGLDIERDAMGSVDTSFSSGTSTFNGSRTSIAGLNSGDAFADYILGLPNDFTQGGRTPQDFYETKWQPFIQDDWKISSRFTLNLGMRWEPWLPPLDKLGPGTGFIPGVQSQVAPFAPTGLLFSGDPGLRDSIYPADWNNFAPRVGFAWDLQGNGKTVVRSAYGIFFRSIPLNLVRVSNSGSAFRSLTVQITNPASFQDPYAGRTNPFPFKQPPNSALSTYKFVFPVVTSVLDPASRTGYTQQWNFTVERQLASDLGISVGYVGNQSRGIMATYQANPAVYSPGATTGTTDARRIYQGLGQLAVASPWGFENYHGLQAQINKRTGHGLTVIANYVYSRCMDNTTSQVLGADAGGGSQYHKFDLHADYAPCDFDVAHTGNVSLVYDLPRVKSSGFTGKAINGWTFTSIIAVRSGMPFSILSGRDNSLTGAPNNDFADQVLADTSRPSGVDKVQQYFNTAAFKQNALGTFGNTQRNTLRGPGFVNFDMGLIKMTTITERVGLQFRAEAFNIFNHPNFANPVSTVSNANFGKITATNADSGDPRVLQFALKLTF